MNLKGAWGGGMDRWTDGWDIFPLFSTGLCPLWFPQGPLPCLHSSYHHEIPEQGKGTDDHLLPLGKWFLSLSLSLSLSLPLPLYLLASYMESVCNRDGPRGGPKVMKPKNQKTEEFQSKELKFKVQKSD